MTALIEKITDQILLFSSYTLKKGDSCYKHSKCGGREEAEGTEGRCVRAVVEWEAERGKDMFFMQQLEGWMGEWRKILGNPVI